jgi:tight adherence protein B
VIPGLLSLAAALLLWPGGRWGARERVAVGGGFPFLARSGRAVHRIPLPVVAAGAAASAAALLSTGLVAILAGSCAGLAGRAWTAGRARGRSLTELAGLAEMLGALGAELRSGRPVDSAARAAAAAGTDERCRRALVSAVCAPGEGADPADPVERALARLSAAVRLSARTGCSLAAVVGAVEDDVRARVRHALELRTATAGPRASAALLAGLPLLGLLMGGAVGAHPWHVLTATGVGTALLVAGVALEVAGVAWSAGLVRRALR